MSAASQGAFVLIPEILHSDISYIIKKWGCKMQSRKAFIINSDEFDFDE